MTGNVPSTAKPRRFAFLYATLEPNRPHKNDVPLIGCTVSGIAAVFSLLANSLLVLFAAQSVASLAERPQSNIFAQNLAARIEISALCLNVVAAVVVLSTLVLTIVARRKELRRRNIYCNHSNDQTNSIVYKQVRWAAGCTVLLVCSVCDVITIVAICFQEQYIRPLGATMAPAPFAVSVALMVLSLLFQIAFVAYWLILLKGPPNGFYIPNASDGASNIPLAHMRRPSTRPIASSGNPQTGSTLHRPRTPSAPQSSSSMAGSAISKQDSAFLGPGWEPPPTSCTTTALIGPNSPTSIATAPSVMSCSVSHSGSLADSIATIAPTIPSAIYTGSGRSSGQYPVSSGTTQVASSAPMSHSRDSSRTINAGSTTLLGAWTPVPSSSSSMASELSSPPPPPPQSPFYASQILPVSADQSNIHPLFRMKTDAVSIHTLPRCSAGTSIVANPNHGQTLTARTLSTLRPAASVMPLRQHGWDDSGVQLPQSPISPTSMSTSMHFFSSQPAELAQGDQNSSLPTPDTTPTIGSTKIMPKASVGSPTSTAPTPATIGAG